MGESSPPRYLGAYNPQIFVAAESSALPNRCVIFESKSVEKSENQSGLFFVRPFHLFSIFKMSTAWTLQVVILELGFPAFRANKLAVTAQRKPIGDYSRDGSQNDSR